MRFDASGAQLRPAAPRKISLPARSEPSDRLAEVIRVDGLRFREHVSAVAVAVAVHLDRVRFPCTRSATLGNSTERTERVNGRLALERRCGYFIVARAAFLVA